MTGGGTSKLNYGNNATALTYIISNATSALKSNYNNNLTGNYTPTNTTAWNSFKNLMTGTI